MLDNLLPSRLSPSQIRSYINFDGLTAGQEGDSSQAALQSQGVAALWQLLQSKRFAYLGDEVGMGKTRQAMGVIATQFLSDPNSHVVIVCPGVTLQDQWVREWDAFIRGCYRAKDNRLISALDGGVLQQLDFHDRLRDFAKSLLLNENRIHLLRYSSFSRPIWFGDADSKKPPIDQVKDVIELYRHCLREIGISNPSEEETEIFEKFLALQEESWRLEMTSLLNEAYAKRVGQLLHARDIDLVVFDEAQYLRHTDNRQNTNIRHAFRSHAKKWLFMSATPLHTGVGDIASLDNYLCIHETGNDSAKKCPVCGNPNCPQARHHLSNNIDVVKILKGFLVRRNRSYQDADRNLYAKVEYRKYDRAKITASEDPFTALTMALVQKRLVTALTGKNNRFRQGECSSFESLSTSLKNSHTNRDGVTVEDKEYEQRGGGDEKLEETPDRFCIDALNQSFRRAMLDEEKAENRLGVKYNLPHAKLNETAIRIFNQNLRNGGNRKSLVFVRRLDTVDELLALMLAQFQEEVDRRLEIWREFLTKDQTDVLLREKVWPPAGFWSWSRDAEDSLEYDEGINAEMGALPEQDEGSIDVGRAGELQYFESLKRYKDKKRENGMLTSFQSRLRITGEINSNPLRGFLLVRPTSDDSGRGSAENASMEGIWINADKCWEHFVEVILGEGRTTLSAKGSPHKWLFAEDRVRGEDSWKLATLKRCILQSFRQSDFIVDLYVMNRFIKQVGHGNDASLQGKLLWFFGLGRTEKLPDDLETYMYNWKEKIRSWIEHFDLIVDKCLRGDDANSWQLLYNKVDGAFARMAPVFGRSGRLQDKNAVTQFKFPTHPNVLICTDVLKEGVDLHLFCDEVIHYGVAWTPGDLEQRIGRVDRFGSMISRNIGKHFNSADPPSTLPKLHVEFPYLDGTLDKHQVERVITAKIKSDLRMDLGKRTDELGFISIEDLESDKALFEQAEMRRSPESLIYFPEGVPEDEDIPPAQQTGVAVQTECPMRTASLENIYASQGGDNCASHIAAIRSVVIRKPITTSDDTGLLRSYLGKSGRKRKICFEEEVLIPTLDGRIADLPTVGPVKSLSNVLSAGEAHAVSGLPEMQGFCYSPHWKTFVYDVKISSPFEGEDERSQVVLLEKVKDYWLLRTPMVKLRGPVTGDEVGSSRWIAEQNVDRRWGYLVEDQGILWFLAFVLDMTGVAAGVYLPALAERVGKTGDRMQHLYVAADDPDDWGYQASGGFPAMVPGANSLRKALENTGGSIMSLEKMDLRIYGQFFTSLQSWFQDTFHGVVKTLYGAVPESSWDLEISPIAILGNGILHLSTLGAERFRLQVFLQLDNSNLETGGFPAPRMIWELAVSPNLVGPKPSLELSSWEDLPHVNLSDWDGEVSEHCGVYTFKGEKYRYLIIYHDPRIWDTSGKKMLEAWGSIVGGMQGGNFMKKWCRDLFAEAVLRQ